ncbi:MAG: rod shape-determining protein MreC [Anaerolineales bacterium]|nr:rod shape-determining protein MreC [Anaerolineales bacterium]
MAAALILVAAAIILLSEGGIIKAGQDLVLRPISGLQSWIAVRYSAFSDLLSSPSDLAALRSRNAELELEVAQLQQEIIALQEQVAEANILSALLDYARTEPENRYLAADVIGKDTSPFLRSIWIGRGSDAGIMKGMPVVTERGLVGRVAEVFATSARIQLITDPELAVNVRMQTSRADGVLAPQLSGELWIDMIEQEADIAPGELVLTSGLGGNYPSNIPVGEVISVRKRDYEIFQQAVIQPSVDTDDLDIVLVITNFRPLPIEIAP